jgi:hypothetical protein
MRLIKEAMRLLMLLLAILNDEFQRGIVGIDWQGPPESALTGISPKELERVLPLSYQSEHVVTEVDNVGFIAVAIQKFKREFH